MRLESAGVWFLGLVLAPLLTGVINRVKAGFAGRRGAPWLQAYYDLWKSLHKAAVTSRTTTWVFQLGPVAGVAAMLLAAACIPAGPVRALLAFPGDWLLLAYLLGVMRFATIAAALDTGSSFEGMGASREAWLSVLAEPAFVFCLLALARATQQTSLSGMSAALSGGAWPLLGPAWIMMLAAFFLILLAENSRVPVDDPNTHLELTMIHEVMVLDHGGPNAGLIQYGAALKLYVFAAWLANTFLPWSGGPAWLQGALLAGGVLAAAAGVGVVESVIARARLSRLPLLLVLANVFAVLALIFILLR